MYLALNKQLIKFSFGDKKVTCRLSRKLLMKICHCGSFHFWLRLSDSQCNVNSTLSLKIHSEASPEVNETITVMQFPCQITILLIVDTG